MRFQKVYIEITNICGLACSFCPTKTLPSKIMPLSFFEEIVPQISHFTKEIALHVMGDPLTLSNLQAYLDIALKHHLLVNITTSGFHLKNHANLFSHHDITNFPIHHPCIRNGHPLAVLPRPGADHLCGCFRLQHVPRGRSGLQPKR